MKKVVSTIDDYISLCKEDVQIKLKELRLVIKELAPDATETISYQMPTFKLNGNLVHFAAYSKHIGFYPTPNAIVKFKNELVQYKTSKGAIQFPIDKPLPIELIKKIVEFRVSYNRNN